MEYVILILLAAIVLSLADAMFYLARDNGARDRSRVVKALSVRIGLSFVLFAVIMLGIGFGLLEPGGG